jgi:hypothetical protein
MSHTKARTAKRRCRFRLVADAGLVATPRLTPSAGSKGNSDCRRRRARRDRPFVRGTGGCHDDAPGWQYGSGSQAFLEPVLDIRVLVKAGHLSVTESRVHRSSLDEVASHV